MRREVGKELIECAKYKVTLDVRAEMLSGTTEDPYGNRGNLDGTKVAMLKHLRKNGFDVTVYDINDEQLARAVERRHGLQMAASEGQGTRGSSKNSTTQSAESSGR